MENNFNPPEKLADMIVQSGIKKTSISVLKTILLGIMAGAFVAFGAEGSTFAIHNIADIGLAKVLAGVIFPVGLILIVLVGGDLFTGNCMIAMACLDKKVKWANMAKNLIIVYLSNLVGSVFIAVLIFLSGQFSTSNNGLGAYVIKIAYGKVNLGFSSAIVSGILCNILVCIAIIAATSAKDVAGKIFAIFFPIWVFVISGFEHCVANMYYIPAGILASTNSEYLNKVTDLGLIIADVQEKLTIGNMIVRNLLPVTIGNAIGGAICIGAFYYIVYKNPIVNKVRK